MNCPYCGNEIRDEKAVYCPYCSKLLRETLRKKTGFPIVAGILTIIAACILSFFAVLSMGAYAWYAITGHPEGVEVIIMGLFSILGFAFGLASGILCLRRRHFGVSITGLSVEILGGFVIIFATAVRSVRFRQAFADAFLLGGSIVVMAILSLIFVAISRKEFS